jgi:hypothetical protein
VSVGFHATSISVRTGLKAPRVRHLKDMAASLNRNETFQPPGKASAPAHLSVHKK